MFINRTIINQNYNDINPVQCGKQICDPSHSYGPATRTYYLLHFVISGKGTFFTQRGKFFLEKNDLFIIRPYEITYYEADKNDPWSYIWIGFNCNITLPTILNSADTVYAPFLEKIFSDAVDNQNFENGRLGYEAFLCGKIFEICAFFYSNDRISSEVSERYIKPALTIMESEFCNEINVGDISKRLHINRSYFSVIFKHITKKTPGEYLSELRMKEAAKLLTIYNCSVAVTAGSVGYTDVFVFSRAFKNYFGCSPTKYATITNEMPMSPDDSPEKPS